MTKGHKLNVAGSYRANMIFALDEKAFWQLQMELDSFLVAENDDLRQELAELRGETDE